MAFAVKPELQGKGHGAKLIHQFLDGAPIQKLPCYLETFKPKNELIYHHFGFKTMEKYPVPGTDFTLFSMLKND